MSFLLHRDTCAACVRHVSLVTNRFLHYRGSLHVSALTVMELEVWLLRPRTLVRYLQTYAAMMQAVAVLNIDESIAHRAAVVASQARARLRMTSANSLIAATALIHGLTLVTHHVQPFASIPGLAVVDWFVP